MRLGGALDVERDQVGARLDEGGDLRERVVDHEVDVLEEGRPHRLDDRRTDRQHRAEDAVHDVDVDELDAGPLEDRQLVAEPAEVGGDHPDRQPRPVAEEALERRAGHRVASVAATAAASLAAMAAGSAAVIAAPDRPNSLRRAR